MATRSFIGVELPNGKVKAVYCHWDGYPEGVGADLLSMGFKNTEEVEQFINEGARSTISESYKDLRGEDCPPIEWDSKYYYFNSDLEEWGYLFTKEGEWVVKDMCDEIGEPERLIDILQ